MSFLDFRTPACAFARLERECRVFVAHDLDADNVQLLRDSSVSVVLHHDLGQDMRRADDLYRWGILVDHNANPPVPGGGSCIFMHMWRGPGQPTVGCTAMPQADLELLLGWLDPERKPLLVQLPAVQYQKLRHRWNLPRMER